MPRHVHRAPVSLLILVLVVSVVSGVSSKKFNIENDCAYTVWPGILSSAGSPPLDSTGFELAPGESRSLPAPHGWSGRLWGRTHCSTDATGRFSCVTGNCGSGQLDCAGHGATPPATLSEFTLHGHEGLDFYDVNLVDGYNLPMLVEPEGAATGANCVPTECMVDLNSACPAELRGPSAAGGGGGGHGVACKSACEAFRSAEHCCSGEYGNNVPAVVVLAVLQERMPEGLQLCVRRRHLHLHLRRSQHVVHHHLLPQQNQREADSGVRSPSGGVHRRLASWRVVVLARGAAARVRPCLRRRRVLGARSRLLTTSSQWPRDGIRERHLSDHNGE